MCVDVGHVVRVHELGGSGPMGQEGVAGATRTKQHKNSLRWSPVVEYA